LRVRIWRKCSTSRRICTVRDCSNLV